MTSPYWQSFWSSVSDEIFEQCRSMLWDQGWWDEALEPRHQEPPAPQCYRRPPEGWITMTREEFNAIQRELQWPQFANLAKDLRCQKIDFNYAKTRKALDPNWNGYSIPKGHDIIIEDADLYTEANLVTSRMQGSDLHRPVLDLDHGAHDIPCKVTGHDLQLNMKHPIWYELDKKIVQMLADLNISHRMPAMVHRLPDGMGRLDIRTDTQFALIDSSTIGHKHLIIGVELEWKKYEELLNLLARCGILEPGFAKASIAKGYSAIRPPWVHK